MKTTIDFFNPSAKLPYEGQAVIVISGGDIFSGVYEKNRFRPLDSSEGFPFDTRNVTAWAKSDSIISSINDNL
jgi:hypothetical protein